MTNRTEWILFFVVVACLLNLVIVVMLLRRRHNVVPLSDIGPITIALTLAHADATANQAATQVSISEARAETKAAARGIRVQLESNQRDNELRQEKSTEKLNFIKAMIARWFTVVPPPMPKGDTSTVHDDPPKMP